MEMGADAVGFIPEHYISPDGLLVPRKSPVCAGVSSRIRRFSRGIQENSDWYVRSIDNVFRDGCGPAKPCSQGYTSLTIGPGGRLYACWPDYLNNRPFSMIDIKKIRMKDVWNSLAYKKKRREILKCNRCFINCVAELNHLVRFW
jgi:radical SAM protein with 4Fe4S-binding SPASM domain